MTDFNASDNKMSALRPAVLSIVVILLLLSDCITKFGTSISGLKIPALLLFAGYGVVLALMERMDKKKILFCLVATMILYAEMPFQDALGSVTNQMLFFGLLAVTVMCAPLVINSKTTLRRAFIAAFVFYSVMMVWSIPDIINQLHFYSATSRLRIMGCFSNPNSLGHITAFLIIMLVSSMPDRVENHKKRYSAKTLSVMAVLLFFIVASGSNTALIETISFISLVFIGNKYDGFSSRAKTLCVLLLFVSLALVSASLFNWAINQETFLMRLNTLTTVNSDKVSLLTGLGYVSSSGISSVTQAAGGAVDMLWVSLLYRVGLIGYFAYAIYFFAAYCGATRSKNAWLIIAFLAVVFLQSMAESYLSSVMSFVSWFIWAFGSALPTFDTERDLTLESSYAPTNSRTD